MLGIWAAVVSGIMFIGLYSWRTAEEARRMAEALAAAELVLAREQKLSALDGFAAAAAHGLGTPLATIAVVAKELMRNAKPSDPHYDDLVLLRAQAERCRTILGELAGMGEQHDFIVSRLPDQPPHRGGRVAAPAVAVPIEVRPGPRLERRGGKLAQEPVMQRNPGVIYGLGNLVENAIDFATSKVEVKARWSEDEVKIEIADDGAGFPAACARTARRALRHHAPRPRRCGEALDEHVGMGLGFFIAKTLLERSGARLDLANRVLPPGGAVVTVMWPRARFEQPWKSAEWQPESGGLTLRQGAL